MVTDLSGRDFGRLKVLARSDNTKAGKARWLCQCSCGNKTIVIGSKLINGYTKSCGCLLIESRIKHSLANHPLYSVWKGMKQRCFNPKASRYERYGGKGITVCQAWRNSFKAFFNDMSPEYQKGLQLDRIDNEKGYSKGNCRWVTPAINVRNRENTIFYKGVCLKEYCKQHNLNYNTVSGRINRYHWPVDKAVLNDNYQGKRGINYVK